MSLDTLLPKIFRCPECGTQLHEILYGMLAEPPKANQVAGGCEWSDDAPTKLCPSCKWEGALGGRSWPVIGSQQVPVEDPTAEYGMRVETIHFDLRTASDDELFQLGRRNINARFELVHRGVDPERIDDVYDQLEPGEAHSWPLVRKNACFLFYDTETQLVEQACIYTALRSMHEFLYLRPGMDEWDIVETLDEFHGVVFGMKKPTLQVWDVELNEDDVEDEDADSEPFNYGSQALKRMLSRMPITEDELFTECDQYERPIYWPHWFNEGTMLNNVQNPWLQR